MIDPNLCAHMALPDIYDPDRAANELGMTVRQLFVHVEPGTIRYLDYGTGRHRMIRFTEEMLQEFLANRTRLNTPKPLVVRTSRPDAVNDPQPDSYRARRLVRQAKKGGSK